MPDNAVNGANGKPMRLLRLPLPGQLERMAFHPATDRATQVARLTARQARSGSGAPGSWSRFLAAHARWIVVFTLAVVGGAATLAHAQTALYTSEAVVEVGFPAAEAGALQAPDMATEKSIVSSGVVLATASRYLNVPQAQLLKGVSASVPASTFLLQIFYSDPNPFVAQERAQAVARAYVSYRSQKPARPRRGTRVSPLAAAAPSATLITPATLPGSPSSPNYLVDIGAALIVGLALGIGTAGLRDHLDDRVRGPLDVQAQAGTPVLALLPSFRSARHDPASRLVMVGSPDSVVAEAYRGLRTRLVQAAAARGVKTLLVTSPGWEDKGAVAANLAVALAQSGRDTILVCADLRWGRVHELFGLTNQGGLTSLLDRRTSPLSVLRATGIPGLRLLPAGLLPPDPAASLQRPASRTVLGEFRRQADFVIIDAPPLLASPDTGPLADLAEMILLVLDARSSARAQVRAAMRELEGVRPKLVGSVLANVGRRRRLPMWRKPKSAANEHRPDAQSQGLAGTGGLESAASRGNEKGSDQSAGLGAALVPQSSEATREEER